MMKKVLVNVSFTDAYTGEKYEAGQRIVMSQERIAEVKEVDRNLISVVGNVPTAVQEDAESEAAEEKSTKKGK